MDVLKSLRSKFEKDWNPPRGRTFGFGLFKVYGDGSLIVTPYLRPEPKDYLDPRTEQVPPAQPEAEVVIPVRKLSPVTQDKLL